MNRKRELWLVGLLVVCLGVSAVAVGPNEVVAWTAAGFQGTSMSWTLESHMRHRLVSSLPGNMNDVISSLEIGSNVAVFIFKHVNFGGWAVVYSASSDIYPYMNDETSSLIIYPKSQDGPYGVELSDRPYTNSVTNKIPNRWFFPLPENAGHTEAEYPLIDGQINDDAEYVLFQGPTMEATFYEHSNYGGSHHVTLSNDPSEWGNAWYQSSMGIWFDLGHFADTWNVKNKISSLKVRWTGAVNLPPMPPMPQVQMQEGYTQVVYPDIGGIWQSTFGYEYEIWQEDNRFRWHNAKFSENGEGLIREDDRILVEWMGTNGAGHDAGDIIYGRNGEVEQIVWDSGNVFFR